ncbi:hypothetical protein [Actinoplanes sp. NPDC049118]|uniref:hypothetical protein n=1 Tax=Actinoplanes sp. NPDC049118 TaxID=3155769 RepID=UPI0033E7E6C6
MGPKHALVYPPEERGRRIRWRVATIGVFLGLEMAAMWAAGRWGLPEELVIPVIAVPYWAVVPMIWSQWGPDMPGVH